MLGVGFDTLKLARSLESAGFAPKQAQDTSAAIAQSFSEWQGSIDLATRDDIRKLELELQKLEARTQADALRLETRIVENAMLIERKAADTIRWVFGISVAQASLIIAFLKMHG